MRVLVLGAGGKTGDLVVERALAAGHTVTAFVHDHTSAQDGRVRVIVGDTENPTAVAEAVEGHDAVIDAIGGKAPYKKTELESKTARHVVDAMQVHGVKRLVVVSMMGVGDSSSQSPFWYEFFSSETTGDFEKFIYHDVVSYIDAHYRTIPDRQSRGLVGHSMGGYGATRIGMKHPEVFGVLYIMSPCCLSPMPAGGPGPADQAKERALASEQRASQAKSPADLAAHSPGFAAAPYASAAAWAPDPKNPPLYFDLPTRNGIPRPEIIAKFTANAPLALVDQYIGNLKQYRAITMDVGDQDGLRIDAAKLHHTLNSYDIPNSFEIYPGTHTSAVADRFQSHVLPFFSQHLCFTNSCH